MKNVIKLFFTIAFSAGFLVSCKKDENKVYFEGGTNPLLTVSSSANLFLDSTKKNTIALVFNWTNPNYRFNTGVSSQNVNYIFQVDTTGSNFTNPNIQETSIASDLSASFTVKQINTFLNKLLMQRDVPHNIEFRIKSTINGTVPLFSNVIKIVITPYLDVAVPLPPTGDLYIT
jgi:starch-binding outer membrane protein SusE/F